MGAELHHLSGLMSDIYDTLGGSLVSFVWLFIIHRWANVNFDLAFQPPTLPFRSPSHSTRTWIHPNNLTTTASYQPMDMRMTHLPLEDDEESRRQSSPPNSIIHQLFKQLMSFSNQLESPIELLSLLRAQHDAARSTISVVASEVTSLDTLVRTLQDQARPLSPIVINPIPPESDAPSSPSSSPQ
jgi:hypothetical protein